MMRFDGVDYFRHLAIFTRQITADDGVRSLYHVLADDLADVMQQPGAHANLRVQPQLGTHRTHQHRHFFGVLQAVLPITRPEF